MSEIAENINEKVNLKKGVQTQRFKNKFYPFYLQLFADILAIVFSYFVQYYIRFETELFGSIQPNIQTDSLILIFPLIALLSYWIFLFSVNGMYKNWYERSPFDEIFTLLKIVAFGCLIIALVVLLTIETSPRMLILIYFIVFSISLLFFRTIARRIQLRLRKNKVINFRTIVIGTKKKANELSKRMQMSPSWGYRPIGIISTEDNDENEVMPVIGKLDDLEKIIRDYEPDSVVIGSKTNKHNLLFKIINICSDRNVRVKIEPDLYQIFTGQTKTTNLYGIPFIEISPNLLKTWQRFSKRLFDIVFSFFILLLGMPVWLFIALMISLESRGGVFYTQPRIGRNGQVFKIYKFRTMKPAKNKDEQKWTTVGDKRVTKFGRFLRKSHLDETPQFWNCLIGDMSIVGPRPEQPKFVEEFSKEIPYYNRRHKVRPGITGWWQIKYDRYELSIEEIKSRLKDDFYYIENMSLKLDFEIIIRTIWLVFKGHGQT